MEIDIMLDAGAKMPTRAHDTDAGLDIYSPIRRWVFRSDSAVIDTGVHVSIPEGYVGMLKAKSGLNVRYGIIGEGVIDAGYTGSIKCKLYNLSQQNYLVKAGDKIIQLVIMPIVTPTLNVVSSMQETERGNNGFGSTGR